MAGRVFGQRYRVVRPLGEGGMGTVYLCEHAVLGRRFAVKVLRPDRAADAELKERFRNEALAACRIGQENVVDVLDFGEEADGALYYVMEALEGRSLGTVMREDGPLPVGRALALLDQVARALGAAHARGVIHRDVKPENVFVVLAPDGTERAKVLDFGISHVDALGPRRITRVGSIIGTPEYMAPEQAVGAEVDHRSDVYALGVLAFEMLTGSLPLRGETAVATLVAHQTQAPAPPSRLRPGVPPPVDALVLRALAKDPAERFESMLELSAEITRIRLTCPFPPASTRTRGSAATVRFEPGEVPAPRAPAPARSPSRDGSTVALPASRPDLAPLPAVDVPLTSSDDAPPRRGGWLPVALAAALLTLGVGSAGWWWARSQEPPRRPAAAPARQAAPPAPAPAVPAAPAARGDDELVAVPEIEPPPPPIPAAAPPAAPDAAPAAIAPSAPPRPRPAAREPEPSVKDPYADEGQLKPDPFR